LQAKLSIGASNDPLEQEADRVADQVLAAPANAAVRDAPLQIQRYAGQATDGVGAAPTSVNRVLAGSGRQMEPTLQRDMEQRFGHDFSQVRIHSDGAAEQSARDVNAHSYTVGHDIVFGAGRFAPGTHEGRRLIAHELTHVVQQTNSDAIRIGHSNDKRGLAPVSRDLVRVVQHSTTGGAQVLRRKPDSQIDRIRDYLSYGLFDWEVTDVDAVAALTILRGLPLIRQAEFVSDTKYADRLRENLPPDRKAEFAQIEKDAQSALPPKGTVESIIDKLSYGLFDWAITNADAIEALEALKGLSAERLAVALNRINYGRLMDNLPVERRQELVDLLEAAVGTGGTTETSEKQEPGVALRSLRFTSDHGIMKDNRGDWTASGKPFQEPEWTVSPEGKEMSAPISHSKDSNVEVEIGMDVAPSTARPAPVGIMGQSDVDFLRFSFSGSASGGTGKVIAMTSAGKVPDEVTAFHDKYVTWKVRWGSREREMGRSGPFTIFTTMNYPKDSTAVTYKRMEKAVELVGSSPTLVPHDIVKNIMFRWTSFNLDVRYTNEWDLAADMETGAQCIDLVRFVQSVIGMVGAPGVAKAVVIWAQPAAPRVAIEDPWPSGGMSSGRIPPYPGQPMWRAILLDGDMRPNNYEAALVFSDSGTTGYYPGGVPSVMSHPDEVLRVFNCLAWIQPVDGGRYEIMDVPASYRVGACTVGTRHSW
jgi:hypothetical protein